MSSIKKILVLNGPNLNLLGRREPKIYGNITLDAIEKNMQSLQDKLSVYIDFIQSNHEGELIETVQIANKKYSGIIINAGGYSHTSIALMDSLKFFGKPIIEVHMSNIYIRENYRHTSYISQVANASICGFGAEGYEMAINCIIRLIDLDYN